MKKICIAALACCAIVAMSCNNQPKAEENAAEEIVVEEVFTEEVADSTVVETVADSTEVVVAE